MAAETRIPAAEYLRMSTERQEYSLENQAAAIRRYADEHGFTIVQTYKDAGKSGLTVHQRNGLKSLLTDVLGARASFRAVLVYDISRWGRFQDTDEAAHYEYLVKSTGIRVHYCAEQFGNDDSLPSRLMKAMKRAMAAEFSRELGEKVLAGKKRLVSLGFHAGAAPGYGLRRVLVSGEGNQKQELIPGQLKSLTTDRVVLVPGPREELTCIKWIYGEFIRRREMADIVKELNLRKIAWQFGKPWNLYGVRQILTNPKYAGCNVWARTTQRLRSRVRPNPPEDWAVKQQAFVGIVDQHTFERAQSIIADKTQRKSNEVLLHDVKRFWKKRGRLSESMIDRARCLPSCSTLRNRFGSMAKLYELIGFQPEDVHAIRTEKSRTQERLRIELIASILRLFKDAKIVKKNKRNREILVLAGLEVGLLLCRCAVEGEGLRYWSLYTRAAERSLPLSRLPAQCQ